jgi:hypothetical protein
MLQAHPTVLRQLLTEYEALCAADRPSPEARRHLEDVSYTLCIVTGTRDVDSAVAAARRDLSGDCSQEGPNATPST